MSDWTANQITWLLKHYNENSIPMIARGLPHTEADVLAKLLQMHKEKIFKMTNIPHRLLLGRPRR